MIDLSHYDTSVDFAQVRAAGVAAVFHQVTQGASYAAPTCAARRKAAEPAGLLRPPIISAPAFDVKAQLANFVHTTAPDRSFLLVVDFERNGDHSMSLDQAKQFLSALEAQRGQRPALYSGNYHNERAGNHPDPSLVRYRVRWAQYAGTPSGLNRTRIGFGSTATALPARMRKQSTAPRLATRMLSTVM